MISDAPGFSFRWLAILFFIYCSILFQPPGLTALEQDKSIADYIMTSFTIADGLPQNSILCLIQTGDGYLWFGTRSGLVRFDGVTPKIFDRWNTSGLKNDTILALYEDDDGVLWVGSDGGGFACLKKGKWQAYTTKHGLSNNRVRVLFKDRRGNLWAGTDYGLNKMRDGRFEVFTDEHGLAGNAIDAVAETSNGELWIAADGETLNLLKEGRFDTIKISEEIPGMEINALYEDRAGFLWIGTELGLYRFKNGRAEQYRALNGFYTKPVRTLVQDKNGALWIGTYGSGLAQLQDNRFSVLNTANGFLDDFIYSLLEDHEGSLWIGSYTNGLIQLQDSRVASIARENGLPENMIYTILEDREGCLWLGSRDSGLCRFKDNRLIKIYSNKDGLAGNRVRALFQDKAANLWIGTHGAGLHRFKEGQFTRYPRTSGLSSDNVNVIFQDSGGALWIGTDNGLNRLNEGEFTTYDAKTGLPETHKNINVIMEESSGALLLGTKGGLLRFKEGSFHPFPDGNAPLDIEVSALYRDNEKDLWIGTMGGGLLRLRKGELTTFTGAVGLIDNYVFSILEDDSGALWLSSYRGVSRLIKTELELVAERKSKRVTAIFFDESDGLKSSECVPGGQPAACKTAAGRLCFPTVRGVAVFDPAAVKMAEKPPVAAIEKVLADNIPAPIAEQQKVTLPEETKMIEFYFTALSFRNPARNRFRYRLDGYEKEWVEADPLQKRTAFYINLPPGKYSFIVTAANDSGIWNDVGARFAFEIASSFFKRPGFYFLLAAAVLLSAGGAAWFLASKKRTGRKAEKYKTSALDPQMADEILPRLLDLMEKEKIYLDGNLTMKKLSERLLIHYNYLSQIINERLHNNFNDFVNKYRIEEAKKRLVDPKQVNKTVLEIAYDTGFYSKSVFNTAFKKFTAMTPSQYREKNYRG